MERRRSRGRSRDRYRRDSRSEGRSRDRRRGSERPPEPALPPAGWRAPAIPPPSRSEARRAGARELPPSRSEAMRAGAGEEEDSRSRSYRNSGRGLPGLDPKSKPEERPASLALGLTTGITAAGAWAARFEIASILEVRGDPGELAAMIRTGKEGPHILSMAQHQSESVTGSTSLGSWRRIESTVNNNEDLPGELFSDGEDWQKEVSKQQAILDSLVDSKGDSLPPWASSSASDKASVVVQKGTAESSASAYGPVSESTPFQKKATPPPGISPLPRAKTASADADSGKDAEVKFIKPATPPPPPPPEDKPSRDRRRRRRDAEPPQTMAAAEAKEMHKFHKECKDIYDNLKGLGVDMEISPLVEQGKNFDSDRFRLLTRPTRAATGLNYTRLMNRFLHWRSDRVELNDAAGLAAKLPVLEFVEHLMQKQVGYLTPRSFLYAVDYFTGAFGFSMSGGSWNRARRLALSFAKSKVTPTSRAPGFLKATLAALEQCVLDAYLQKPERVACGKLRLCIQASTRSDDVLNTPLAACEWVRRPGERQIIGLRSRALRGKSGARLWVASLRGVCPGNDGWLLTLVDLLLESHGATWKTDDHLGKNSKGDVFIKSPARLERDVELVKCALAKLQSESIDIGMTSEEVDVLRWHGAKATLSSIMQHLDLPKRAVRWQGNWKKQTETMPDTYLRESQVLILSSQEKCLEYLRAGGDLVRLVGEPVGLAKVQEDREAESSRCAKAMACDFGAGAEAGKVAGEFFDGCFQDGKLTQEVLEKEKASTWKEKDLEQWLESQDQESSDYEPTSAASEGEMRTSS